MMQVEKNNPDIVSDSQLRDFPIISSLGEEFCVYSEAFGVWGTGKSITEAYSDYQNKFLTQRKLQKKFGVGSRFTYSKPDKKSYEVINELFQFFIKTIVASISIALVIILLIPHVGASLHNQVNLLFPNEIKSGKYWAINFPANINSKLDGLPKEDQERLVIEWRKLISRFNNLVGNADCR